MASFGYQIVFVATGRMKQVHAIAIGSPDDERWGWWVVRFAAGGLGKREIAPHASQPGRFTMTDSGDARVRSLNTGEKMLHKMRDGTTRAPLQSGWR
jgi:hypothetical protein